MSKRIHIGDQWVSVPPGYIKAEMEYTKDLLDQWDQNVAADIIDESLRQKILDKRVELYQLYKTGQIQIKQQTPPKLSWWNTLWRKIMDNQHKHIKGYRDLSQEEIDLMNEGKALAEQVGEYIKKLENTNGLDQRWVAIGKTDIQKGFMSVIRSIAQPTTF